MVMMFRLTAIALLVFFASTFGPSQADIETKILEMDREIKALKTRLNGAHVQCEDQLTPWAAKSDAPIMFLDRQNVECAKGKFLARFHLTRQGSDDDSHVHYEYRCCQLIL
ncbi:hypothetical protein ABFA07_010552 [Porites harrisoni]